MSCRNAFVTIVALFLLAPLQAEEKPADLKKLDGTWRMEKLTRTGVDTARSPLFDATWILKDGKVTYTDGKVTRKHEIKIDSSKNPMTIDFVYLEGDNKGKKSLGIYKLEGENMLVLCWGEPGKERPTKFETKPGENTFVQVLMRQKKP